MRALAVVVGHELPQYPVEVGADHSVPTAGRLVGLFNEEHNRWVDVSLDDGAFIGNGPGQYDIPNNVAAIGPVVCTHAIRQLGSG